MEESFNYIPLNASRGFLEKSNIYTQVLMLVALTVMGGIIFTAISMACALWLFHVPNLQTLQTILSTQPSALSTNINYLNALKFMQLLSQIGMMGVPALIFALMMGKTNDFLHVRRRLPVLLLLSGVTLVVVISPFINWLSDLNQRLWLPHFMKPVEDWMRTSEDANDKLTHVFTQMGNIKDLIINLIIIAFAAGLCEELLFRGCLQNILFRYTKNPHISIWMAAIVFSAIHMQFYGFVPRMVLGALLGYMYYFSGNIWVNATMHAFYNGLQVILLYLFQKKLIQFNIDNDNTAPSIWMAALSIACTISIILWVRNRSIKINSFIKLSQAI